VPNKTAGVMYFAILAGGPKWIKLVKGKPCPAGLSCINQLDVTTDVPGANLTINEDSQLFLKRAETYASPAFDELMEANLPALQAEGDALTPEQVEAIATRAMATDFYYRNGDEIGSGLSVQISVD
jgi:hypothetical protein